MSTEPLIPKHGGYRKLNSFQIAQLIYDVTVRFCNRKIDPRSRTHDQMLQAARSEMQNIAERSPASATSKKTELKLTSVARASLEELRFDYEDFLRQMGRQLWERNDHRKNNLIEQGCSSAGEVARWVKEIHEKENHNSSTTSTLPELAANAALILISVACSLLVRQISSLATTSSLKTGSPKDATGCAQRTAKTNKHR